MRIAIVGSGGLGGYYGGLLARAGHEVSFIARGAHLAALRQKGLQEDEPPPSSSLAVHMAVAPEAMPDRAPQSDRIDIPAPATVPAPVP